MTMSWIAERVLLEGEAEAAEAEVDVEARGEAVLIPALQELPAAATAVAAARVARAPAISAVLKQLC